MLVMTPIVQENNKQVAAQCDEDCTKWTENSNVNNEYVEPEDPYPDEFEDDGWVNLTYVGNITAEFNRCTVPITTKDLKMGIYLNQKLNCYKRLPSCPLSMECHLLL